MRQLATVQEIKWVRPIEGKDRIVLAGVLGWSVIVQKADFDVGTKCVYCEIDSVLPDKPEFEFLRSKGFRIKTMKMAGCISQGICFPLTVLPAREKEYEVGEDVTDLIGVRQYEPTMDTESNNMPDQHANKYPKFLRRWKWFRKWFMGHNKNGSAFPTQFISKTDETRIQSIPWILEHKSEAWVATEKVDGTSGSFLLVRHKRPLFLKDKFEYIVCSRNMRLKRDNSIYWQVSDKYHVEDALLSLIGNNAWVAIQGECIGPKVQGNKYKKESPELYVFNVIFPKGRMSSVNARNLVGTRGLDFVPIIETDYTLPDTVDDVLAYAHGQSVLGGTLREGVVFRTKDGTNSFKAVDPEFLLKYNE